MRSNFEDKRGYAKGNDIMRQKLEQFMTGKQMLAFNFAAAAGGKLISINGTITEVGDDYITALDIYGNVMVIPLGGIAYIEVKK